jgi:spore coat polysaccharide biosynthesis protein SpsF (cytidylyltransferase family)
MKIVTIIQARMGSSRLPGKVMLTLVDQPVLQWVYERAARIPLVDETIVATTSSVADDPVASWCVRRGIAVFRGSEDDVLDRYLRCARANEADAVVRITADCPLLDPEVSGRVVAAFLGKPGCEYANNTDPWRFPDGLDTEVISRHALEVSAREAADPADREHVTRFVRRREPDRFRTKVVVSERDLSNYRWTLDDLSDFTFLAAVAERLRDRGLSGSMAEVLSVLADEPRLQDLNRRDLQPTHTS